MSLTGVHALAAKLFAEDIRVRSFGEHEDLIIALAPGQRFTVPG